MKTISLLVFVVVTCIFAFSMPKRGQTFSPFRTKLVKGSRYLLVATAILAMAYTGYNTLIKPKPPEFIIEEPYAVRLTSNNHRLFFFKEPAISQVLIGEDAVALMNDIFGNSKSGKMVNGNEGGSWLGKLTARVYYSEEAYNNYLNGKPTGEGTSNSMEKGRVYYFYIYEDGSVYCNFNAPDRPYFKNNLSKDVKKSLFP